MFFGQVTESKDQNAPGFLPQPSNTVVIVASNLSVSQVLQPYQPEGRARSLYAIVPRPPRFRVTPFPRFLLGREITAIYHGTGVYGVVFSPQNPSTGNGHIPGSAVSLPCECVLHPRQTLSNGRNVNIFGFNLRIQSRPQAYAGHPGNERLRVQDTVLRLVG